MEFEIIRNWRIKEKLESSNSCFSESSTINDSEVFNITAELENVRNWQIKEDIDETESPNKCFSESSIKNDTEVFNITAELDKIRNWRVKEEVDETESPNTNNCTKNYFNIKQEKTESPVMLNNGGKAKELDNGIALKTVGDFKYKGISNNEKSEFEINKVPNFFIKEVSNEKGKKINNNRKFKSKSNEKPISSFDWGDASYYNFQNLSDSKIENDSNDNSISNLNTSTEIDFDIDGEISLETSSFLNGFISDSENDENATSSCEEFSETETEEKLNFDCNVTRSSNHENSNLGKDFSLNLNYDNCKKNKLKDKNVKPKSQPTGEENKKRYTCDTCKKSFRLKHHLKQHTLTHTTARANLVRTHKCSICSKQFKLKHHLQRHMLCHTKEKKFKCATCDKSYVDKSTLIKHMVSHNVKANLVKLKSFSCNLCGMDFETKTKLYFHRRSHGKACAVCGKIFQSSKYLRYHLQVHAKLTNFSCDVCGKSFPFKATLMEHSRKHTGDKPYQCEICHRAFTTQSNQMRHVKSHLKIHSCRYCHSEFPYEELQQHVKICDKKRKTYYCDKCDWNFEKCSNYKRHMSTHYKYLTPESITIDFVKKDEL